MKPGPKYDQRRDAVADKYGLVGMAHMERVLSPDVLDQLERCADDCARRLILGVSEQYDDLERAA